MFSNISLEIAIAGYYNTVQTGYYCPLQLLFDHPRSGVVYNFGCVCLSVCVSVRR